MKRLFKYLKPYTVGLLIAIALLFIQANFDLALPDYTSRIINVGIQQSGIEDAVPLAIRTSQMEKLFIFMSEAEQADILDSYTLVDADSPDFDRYVETYSVLNDEPIYIRNDLEQEQIEQLIPIMGKTLLTVSGIEKMIEDPENAPPLSQDGGFDPSQIPPDMDVFALLSQLPTEKREQITASMNESFSALGENVINQAAVSVIKDEYEALGMESGKLQNAYMLRTGAIMLIISLLAGAASITVGYISARIAAGLARDLRRYLFEKVENFSSVEFDHFSTASLITRTTNDITQIQMVIMIMVRMVFYAPIIGVGGVLRALNKDASMWWIIALAVSILIGIIIGIYNIAVPKFKLVQKLTDRLNLVTRENLAGMMVIRAFNMENFEEERFDKANQELTGVSLFISRVMVVMMPIMMLIMNGLTVLIIWVGAHQVAQSSMQVGDMIAFMQYAIQIVFAFLMLSMMFIILPRAQVSADRIADVLETDLTITDPEKPKTLTTPIKGKIEFRNVSFRYPGAEEDVLHDITFTAHPGQTTAFIGSTGSGKSTAVNLIPRFYDVTEGVILLDGIDIRELKQHDLRDQIGYVPQKGTLFTGTIESNLRYADEEASSESLEKAAEIAQAVEFITAKPEGWESEVAQGGTNVSGGQRQRLSIARALVKQPPIYLFDDSFSALDFKTDTALRKALKKSTGESSILIVTQRVSTVKTVEQIIVLDEGRIMGKGTHKELMANCVTYQEIARSQLSEEELA